LKPYKSKGTRPQITLVHSGTGLPSVDVKLLHKCKAFTIKIKFEYSPVLLWRFYSILYYSCRFVSRKNTSV